MSNARIRRRLELMSAPVIAWLIDNGYVADDCGILNTTCAAYSLGQGMLNASRSLPMSAPSTIRKCPGCGTTSDAHSIMCKALPMSKRARERL